jgi:riboflavin synthase
MFTGLVAARGVLTARDKRGPGARVTIETRLGAEEPVEPLVLGESIAIDGACLSVAELVPGGFAVDATIETLSRTTLGALPLGHLANLERSVRAGDRLGGHLVTGHVDAVGTLVTRRDAGEAVGMTFSFPRDLGRLVAEKGSIAINGVSMTVNGVRDSGSAASEFDVMVIPITQRETNLGGLAPGSTVNLEIDLVARYVARWLGAAGTESSHG